MYKVVDIICKYLPLIWLALTSQSIAAGDAVGSRQLPAPQETVLLTVSGNIQHYNATEKATTARTVELDLTLLESLGMDTIVTKTVWTKGATRFDGVLLSNLLDYVGAQSSQITLTGLDGYTADLGDIDFTRYPVLIAYKRDSEYMTVRDLGPLWLMFPFDDYPELLNDTNKSAAVWQLIRLVVR